MKKDKYVVSWEKGRPVCYKAIIWRPVISLKDGETLYLAKFEQVGEALNAVKKGR